mmetsp:Transcript_22646/g.26138  ORF Transcript_22646/g.26138 Transcript_22646/m.26138 type:complete len:558 (-) Transcript_22646:264-1937(-)
MGTYLSTPVLEKHETSGCDDLSALVTKIDETSDTRSKNIPVAWGCVDMQGWRKSMEDAHVARLDVSPPIKPLINDQQQLVTKTTDCDKQSNYAKVFSVFDGHGGPEVARFCDLYLVHVLVSQKQWNSFDADGCADVGGALINCFHELDCMIDDPNRRDELSNLRAINRSTLEMNKIRNNLNNKTEALSGATGAKPATSTPPAAPLPLVPLPDNVDQLLQRSESTASGALSGGLKEGNEGDDSGEKVMETSAVYAEEQEKGQMDNCTGDEGENQISPSEPAVMNADNETITDDDNSKEGSESSSSLGSEGDSTAVAIGDEDDSIDDITDLENIESVDSSSNDEGGASLQGPVPVTSRTFQNGRKVCTLPDHPIHAGCTAVVAVLVNDVLTVANAGDSRAVLCRKGGVTEALSYDHKPLQEREMDRITKSGGFVNQFGRVNGNLNLSRSIGDLKYKQTKSLPPSAQMITAEPDILQVKLNPGDEFFILGCDGIWDCLSNEQAVLFVRDRIETKAPTEIVIEMLDEIVSDDPRATQGIGGDNMTCMIIDLLPHSRSYRKT